MRTRFIPLLILALAVRVSGQGTLPGQGHDFPFNDWKLPLVQRVADLLSRLTLEEKVLQMQNDAPAIPGLGIPAYNWWNECLHGVARNGIATVFPQAIGMAATWDPALVGDVATVISTEARAKHHEAINNGKSGLYQGLTFWSPNINIFRDPRWGRGQETYGEDPYLTARIGVAFVEGLQGNDPHYYKVISTAKHFAVHSGPEPARHSFDAWCSEQDLYETYLPAFEALVREGGAGSVMGAYNRFWNVPCCASDLLLDSILRKKWGFQGYVTSDCGAIWDMFNGHALVKTPEQASVLGIKAGCDLTCGDEYQDLPGAVKKGYISEKEIDKSLARLFTARFRLGMFDPDSIVPYATIRPSENDKEESRQLARKAARESIVLLKNDNGTLPLSKKIRSVAVIGPYADKQNVLLGNYHGTPSKPVTVLQGIKNTLGKNARLFYAAGANPLEVLADTGGQKTVSDDRLTTEALDVAGRSEVILFVGGISPDLEGEESDVKTEGFVKGDRTTLDLPRNQQELLEKLAATGKPIVLILVNGSCLSITWVKKNIPAIVEVWYPGEEGGNALADVLFGDYNPAGRLPVTFYSSVNDLPPFEDYSMANRTYRYFTGTPLYAFGYGLSYTTFTYQSVRADYKTARPGDTLHLTVTLKNSGNRDGDEVVQVYASKPGSVNYRPIRALKAFQRVHLAKGETREVKIPLIVNELRYFDPAKQDYTVEPGNYQLLIGASADDIRLELPLTVIE
jgi:beta-glucosidase